MVQSVQRAVRLLELLDGAGRNGRGLAELARAAGLKPSTTRNLLATLCDLGYAAQSEPMRVYRLGRRARRLGQPRDVCERLRRAARPVLERLREAVDETLLLTVYTAGRRRTVLSLESARALRVGGQTGEDTHFYTTATGRLLMALLPEPERAALVAALGPPSAEQWPEALAGRALRRQFETLAGARRSVYERTDGQITALAVPLCTGTAAPPAALGLYYPAVRDSRPRRRELFTALEAAALQISDALGIDPKASRIQRQERT